MVLLILSFLIMQPQGQVIWSIPATGGIYNAVPTADMNHDGHPDVLAVVYYGAYPSPPIRLYLVSGIDGSNIWTRGDCQGTWGNKGLGTIDDISGDSIQDFLLGTPGGAFPGSTVFAINGLTGNTIWSWCTYTQGPNWGWVYTVKSAPDRNNDGYPEALASAGGNSNNPSGTAFCFSGHTGETLWTFRPPLDGAQCICSFIDVNNDTVPEVIVGAGGNGYDNRVFCVNGRNGQQIWAYNTGNSVWDVEPFCDANNNQIPDVIAGGWSDKVFCLEGSNSNLIWQNDIGYVVMEVVPIKDVNNDGIDDVIVGSWSNSVYLLSGTDGTVLWSQPIGQDCWSVDTLTDVTGDRIPEVIVGALNGRLVKVLNGTNGEVLWSYNFVDRVYDVTGAPDLDGDGYADVLVSLQDQNNQPYQLYAFKGVPVGMVEDNKELKIGLLYSVSYREDEVILKLSVPRGEAVGYQIYDALGRIVEHNWFKCAPDGVNYLHIKKAGKSAGIYFVRIAIGRGASWTVKIFLK